MPEPGHLYRQHGFCFMKIIYRSISGCVLDYWGPKAPGSCYYTLLGSPFASKSCLRVRSSMKAEPPEDPGVGISIQLFTMNHKKGSWVSIDWKCSTFFLGSLMTINRWLWLSPILMVHAGNVIKQLKYCIFLAGTPCNTHKDITSTFMDLNVCILSSFLHDYPQNTN